MLQHHKALGNLRKDNPALRLGETEFFFAEGGRIGFAKTAEGQKLRCYVNRSKTPWEIPAGKILYGRNLRSVAPNWLRLAPMGMCILEEV